MWGCGPVGQFAIKSAFLLGAERVIAIDTVPERSRLAEASGAITLDFKVDDIYDRIQDLTGGRGRMHASTRLVPSLIPGLGLMQSLTASRLRPSWGPIAPTCFGKRSSAAATSAWFQLWAFTVGSLIRYPWDRRLIAALHSEWLRPRFSIIFLSFSIAFNRARSTRHL